MLTKFPHHKIRKKEKIAELKKILSNTLLFNKRTLKNCKIQLHKLHRNHSSEDAQMEDITLHLQLRYERLRTRRSVIQITEKAEELANESPYRSLSETKNSCNILRNRILNLFDNTRPTLTDVRFLRFAQNCLKKAEQQEPLLGMGKKKKNVMLFEQLQRKNIVHIPKKNYILAEFLFELAEVLRFNNTAKFSERIAQECSPSMIKEISYHIQHCGGSLQAPLEEAENQLAIIKGLIGYAQILTDYYVTLSPYPSTQEVTKHFKDLDYLIAST